MREPVGELVELTNEAFISRDDYIGSSKMPDIQTSLRWNIARAAFYVNRFSALPRAERLFRGAKPGTFVERRLFGHNFVCDVSRSGPQKLIYLLGERFVAEAIVIRG